MKITVIGGGPGGLYFSILAKKANPSFQIDVYERNQPDDAFGFGVVFSDETLSEFLTRDPQSYDLIRSRFAYWDDLDVVRNGEQVRISGNGFCGCSRKTLLQLLQQRCLEEGVGLHYNQNIDDLSVFADSNLILAADGINSAIRDRYAEHFGTKISLQRNKFVWLGSTRPLDAFAYFFRSTPYGTIVAHTYQYEPGMSTWIFECAPETWQKAGFDTFNDRDTIEKLSSFFAQELDGHPLISNKSHWRQFPAVTNEKWHYNNIILLGDAKATAHYSIGSGTKLAMECAIALADAVTYHPGNIHEIARAYDQARRNRVEMIQHAAMVSLDWFENMDRHMQHPFLQFAFGVMTRAKKVTFENLALRDPSFTSRVLAAFNLNLSENFKTPAGFTRFKLREMELINRIVMAPMEQHHAQDGLVNDWHLVHYASRAIGGVGLIMTQATAVSERGKITPDCTMLKSEEHARAWLRIANFIHTNTRTKIAVQLGHAGRRSAVKMPLPPLSASALRYDESLEVPEEITAAQMEHVVQEFKNAAALADKAGFDMIELQAHHGFLLASFLSPLTNKRTDEFGGEAQNRIKFPLMVFNAIRQAFPAHKPIAVRLSVSDWAEGGLSEQDALFFARAFKEAGADLIDVSSGYTVAGDKPPVGRMWQTPLSDRVRNSVGIPTVTAGSIQDIDQINTILLNGRADLVALGRPLLLDPGFVRNAQAYEQFDPGDIPADYRYGMSHLYPLKAAERKEKEGMKKALKPESHQK